MSEEAYIADKSTHVTSIHGGGFDLAFSTVRTFHFSSAGKHVDPYREPLPERDTYITLLRQDPSAPEATLKATFIWRAIADVHLDVRLRKDRPAFYDLLQKGSIGEELWDSLLAAERGLEGEVKEVRAEANTFVGGWGSLIFPTANEAIANERMRVMFDSTSKLRAEKCEHASMLVWFPNASFR